MYIEKKFFGEMEGSNVSQMPIPGQGTRHSPDFKGLRQGSRRPVSRGASRIRQPIESLINEVIEKMDIRCALWARFNKGLIVHAYGRLAAVFITLIF